jgi:hypothetical protein
VTQCTCPAHCSLPSLSSLFTLVVLKIYDVRPHDTNQVFTEVESLRPTEKKLNLSYSAVDVQWHPTESACPLPCPQAQRYASLLHFPSTTLGTSTL